MRRLAALASFVFVVGLVLAAPCGGGCARSQPVIIENSASPCSGFDCRDA
jgi:hypothetical protein